MKKNLKKVNTKKVNTKKVKKINDLEITINSNEKLENENIIEVENNIENQNIIENENNIEVENNKIKNDVEVENIIENEINNNEIDLIDNNEIDINAIETSNLIEKNDKKNNIKKTNLIYEILSSKKGGTLQELMEKTGWQKHSIRGTLTNLQKDLEFTLIKVDVSKPDPVNRRQFIKETRYFIKNEFFTADQLFNNENEIENIDK